MKTKRIMLNYFIFSLFILIPLVGSLNSNASMLETNSIKNTDATTLTVLIVLMELPDDPHHPDHTTTYYQDLFFSDKTDTVKQYYLNVSYGEVSLVGDVIGWKTTKHFRSYYGQGARTSQEGYTDAWPDELVYEAYNYSIEEGNDPTTYDLFVVLHSGDGQEYSGSYPNGWPSATGNRHRAFRPGPGSAIEYG